MEAFERTEMLPLAPVEELGSEGDAEGGACRDRCKGQVQSAYAEAGARHVSLRDSHIGTAGVGQCFGLGRAIAHLQSAKAEA